MATEVARIAGRLWDGTLNMNSREVGVGLGASSPPKVKIARKMRGKEGGRGLEIREEALLDIEIAKKFVSARRRNQHSGRVRSPEFAAASFPMATQPTRPGKTRNRPGPPGFTYPAFGRAAGAGIFLKR